MSRLISPSSTLFTRFCLIVLLTSLNLPLNRLSYYDIKDDSYNLNVVNDEFPGKMSESWKFCSSETLKWKKWTTNFIPNILYALYNRNNIYVSLRALRIVVVVIIIITIIDMKLRKCFLKLMKTWVLNYHKTWRIYFYPQFPYKFKGMFVIFLLLIILDTQTCISKIFEWTSFSSLNGTIRAKNHLLPNQ